MAFTREMVAQIEAQRAHFASDEHIREEVEIWAETSPDQRLAELAEMCRAAEFFWSRLDPSALERMRALRALPPDTIGILEGIRRASR